MPFLGCAVRDILLAIITIILVSIGIFGDVIITDDILDEDKNNLDTQGSLASIDNSGYVKIKEKRHLSELRLS